MKERIYYLDVIRCLACVMVVAMHAPVPDGGLPGFVVVPISLAAAPCIGLFFMVSGALLLPSKGTGIEFFKKRFGKIVWPLLFWTIVAMTISFISNGLPSLPVFLKRLFSIPFSYRENGVYWFMYALLGVYLLAPIFSPWLERASKRELELYLLLWCTTLCYPFLKIFLNVEDGVKSGLYYFNGYAGYFLLGYYLKLFGKMRTKSALLYLPIPFIALGLCEAYGFSMDLLSHFWYLSIFTALSCVSWFMIAKNNDFKIACWSNSLKNFVEKFSNYSFGIYLVHIFIMRTFLWDICGIGHWGGILSFMGSFGITLVLSYAITAAISYLPFAEYLIGYRSNR